MELDLKELGLTLLVGAFTILSCEAILHYFFNIRVIGFFEGRLGLQRKPERESPNGGQAGRRDDEATLTLAVFIAFAFAIGVLFEDFSKRSPAIGLGFITTVPANVIPDSVVRFLRFPPKEDDRVVTLIGDWHQPPQPLLVDLAAHGAFRIHGSERDLRVQDWIKNQNCQLGSGVAGCPSESEVRSSILDLYFFAKNTAYAQDHYYDELRQIQARYDFLGTLSVLAFFYFWFAVLSGIIVLIRDRKKTRAGASRRCMLAVIAILFCVYVFSLWGFARESQEFNLRVFGYLSTKLISEDRLRTLEWRREPKPITGEPMRPAGIDR